MTSETDAPGPGWHPDPWFSGQHRYWDGRSWTADVFPDGPLGAYGAPHIAVRPDGQRPPVAPPTTRSAVAPPPPTWGLGATVAAPTTAFTPWEMLPPPVPAERRRLTHRQINALALAVGLVLGFAVVAKVVSSHGRSAAATAPAPAPVAPVLPTVPASPSPVSSTPISNDPSASLLQRLVVRQQDVSSANRVELLDGGNQVTGQTTLDLCNGRFPSEALRSARLQVVEYDGGGAGVLSTEAVLYRRGSDAAQAMQEVASVAAHCPDGPVVSPVGEPTVTTRFQAAPDKAWPTVAGVERLAFAFTTTDSLGVTEAHVAVYLRRGRVLEGVYFPSPAGSQPPVNGQTSIAAIVGGFERRIAALPGSAVAG